ncbi:MAG: DUF4249 domain-containing protein [Bacteroidota bacterium]
MKTTFRFLFIVLVQALTSCEDVIDVEVQTEPERLTVEASLDWEKGTSGNMQSIRLGKSTPFFDTTGNTAVTGASVRVLNDSDGTEFVFADQGNGEYNTDTFIPILNQSYTLEIQYNGDTYSATETMMAVTDITEINQTRENGFDEDALEVNIIFTDPAEEGNAYLFRFQEEGDLLPDLEEFNDEFVNGNQIEWYYEKESEDDEEEFVPGDVIDIDFHGISEDYHNYMRILIEQSGGVDLFGTIPAALRGNCINLTDPDNYAHGYFRLTQVVKARYEFQ